MRRSVRALAAILLSLVARAANAELGDDAARLVSAWRQNGKVERLAPRFAERGLPAIVFVPPELAKPSAGACTSIAILGPSSTHFTARAVGPGALEDPDDWPQPSLAGMVQLTRCGARRSRLGTLLVEMRSPRAVLETIAVDTRTAVRPAIEVLPQRNPGPIEPMGGPTPRPEPPPIDERLSRAALRLARDGGRDIARDSVKSSLRGGGKVQRVVEAGCHRLTFFAEAPKNGAAVDELEIEPELDAASSVVALEQGDGLEAAVTICAAERSMLNIGFAGAPSEGTVHVLAATWPLPEFLPEAWGSTARARVAAMLMRHDARIEGPPIDQALGVQGPTLMPIAVEPGACYVAVLVAVRGAPQAMALAAVSGDVTAQNHGGQGGEGTLLSFCARSRSHAVFEADSRGAGLFWLFALFQNGRVALGEERD